MSEEGSSDKPAKRTPPPRLASALSNPSANSSQISVTSVRETTLGGVQKVPLSFLAYFLTNYHRQNLLLLLTLEEPRLNRLLMYLARLLARFRAQTQREKVAIDQLEVVDEAEEEL